MTNPKMWQGEWTCEHQCGFTHTEHDVVAQHELTCAAGSAAKKPKARVRANSAEAEKSQISPGQKWACENNCGFMHAVYAVVTEHELTCRRKVLA